MKKILLIILGSVLLSSAHAADQLESQFQNMKCSTINGKGNLKKLIGKNVTINSKNSSVTIDKLIIKGLRNNSEHGLEVWGPNQLNVYNENKFQYYTFIFNKTSSNTASATLELIDSGSTKILGTAKLECATF